MKIAYTITYLSGKVIAKTIDVFSLSDVKTFAKIPITHFPALNTARNVLTDLLYNAVEHGNLGISYEEKTALIAKLGNPAYYNEEIPKRMKLEKYNQSTITALFQEYQTTIGFIIKDEGAGFDWEKFTSKNNYELQDNQTHGWGIQLASQLLNEFSYQGNGNTVTGAIAKQNTE